jgi:hypothetical protein
MPTTNPALRNVYLALHFRPTLEASTTSGPRLNPPSLALPPAGVSTTSFGSSDTSPRELGPDSEAIAALLARGGGLWELYSAHVRAFPFREVLVVHGASEGGRRLTYNDLAEGVETLGATVHLSTEERVGVWLGNCEEWVGALLACARARVPLAAVPLSATPAEAQAMLRAARVTTLVRTTPSRRRR